MVRLLISALLILCSGWIKELQELLCLTVGAGFKHKLAPLIVLIPWRCLTTWFTNGLMKRNYGGCNKLVNGVYKPTNKPDWPTPCIQPTMIWYRGLQKKLPSRNESWQLSLPPSTSGTSGGGPDYPWCRTGDSLRTSSRSRLVLSSQSTNHHVTMYESHIFFQIKIS